MEQENEGGGAEQIVQDDVINGAEGGDEDTQEEMERGSLLCQNNATDQQPIPQDQHSLNLIQPATSTLGLNSPARSATTISSSGTHQLSLTQPAKSTSRLQATPESSTDHPTLAPGILPRPVTARSSMLNPTDLERRIDSLQEQQDTLRHSVTVMQVDIKRNISSFKAEVSTKITSMEGTMSAHSQRMEDTLQQILSAVGGTGADRASTVSIPSVESDAGHGSGGHAPTRLFKEMLPSKFSGKPNEQDWGTFMLQFDIAAQVAGFGNIKKCQLLGSLLDEPAKTQWAIMKPADRLNWDKLVTLMTRKYAMQEEVAQSKLQARSRKSSEEAKTYAADLIKLTKQAFPKLPLEALDHMVLAAFKQGHSKELQKRLGDNDISTLDDAVDIVERYEAIEEVDRKGKPCRGVSQDARRVDVPLAITQEEMLYLEGLVEQVNDLRDPQKHQRPPVTTPEQTRQCYSCGAGGTEFHLARYCPLRQNKGWQRNPQRQGGQVQQSQQQWRNNNTQNRGGHQQNQWGQQWGQQSNGSQQPGTQPNVPQSSSNQQWGANNQGSQPLWQPGQQHTQYNQDPLGIQSTGQVQPSAPLIPVGNSTPSN